MTIHQLIIDAENWNRWAAQVNQRALTAGLVSEEELTVNHTRSQRCLDRLRSRLTKEKGPSSARCLVPTPIPHCHGGS